MNQVPKIGWIVHVRTSTSFGWAIRKCLNAWHRKFCDATDQKFVPVWGNHDGIIVPCQESQPWCIGVGEAEPFQGSIVTPWEVYLRRIEKGTHKVRLLSVIGESDSAHEFAALRWKQLCEGKTYDWLAIWKIFLKAIWGNFSDQLKDWKFAIYCTEGVGTAWRFTQIINGHLEVINPLQVPHPTPMTVEQIAEWIPRKPKYKTTLKEEQCIA